MDHLREQAETYILVEAHTLSLYTCPGTVHVDLLLHAGL